MTVSTTNAINHAVSIISAGLSSGAIKLNQNIHSADAAEKHATGDAIYLSTLLLKLAEAVRTAS